MPSKSLRESCQTKAALIDPLARFQHRDRFSKGQKQIVRRMRFRPTGEVALSAVGMSKLWFGAFKSAQADAVLSRLEQFDLPVLAFDAQDARCAGEVRAALSRAGRLIGAYDILIAGQALARDLTLVTDDTREFSRVSGLRIEDREL